MLLAVSSHLSATEKINMGYEIDLLRDYPKSIRDVRGRAMEKTDEHREIARQFGEAFFDGKRDTGYGGFLSAYPGY